MGNGFHHEALNEEVEYTADDHDRDELLPRSQVDDESRYNPEAIFSAQRRQNQLMERKLQAVFAMAFLTAVTSLTAHTLLQQGNFRFQRVLTIIYST
jgi:hypothetical protein